MDKVYGLAALRTLTGRLTALRVLSAAGVASAAMLFARSGDQAAAIAAATGAAWVGLLHAARDEIPAKQAPRREVIEFVGLTAIIGAFAGIPVYVLGLVAGLLIFDQASESVAALYGTSAAAPLVLIGHLVWATTRGVRSSSTGAPANPALHSEPSSERWE